MSAQYAAAETAPAIVALVSGAIHRSQQAPIS
jgi:hypothetical protein